MAAYSCKGFDPIRHRNRQCGKQHDYTPSVIASISIVPNPAGSTLHLDIQSSGKTTFEYEIFNLLGEKAEQKKQIVLHEGNNNNLIDIKQLPSGSYYFKVVAKNQNFNIPFVVIH